MNKLKLLFTVLFLAVLGLGNVWATTYKLTQATSVAAGKKYVFIQDTHAFGSTVSSSALQTVTGYNTTGLAGTEAYVWTLETATGGFYMKNVSLSSNQYLNNSSSTSLSFGSKNSIWTFDFTDANAVLIQNKSNSSRFLGYTTATSYVYKAYATGNLSNYPHAIKVYVLEEETSGAPTCSTPTITFAEGAEVAKLTSDAAFTNAASVEFESVATGQTVSWSVEDGKAGVATVNATTGEVTIKGAGTAKIYASVEANATYCEKSAYYTLTVTEPPFEGTIVTMKAANDADIKFVTGSSAAASAVWANSTPLSAKGITLSGVVTSGTNYTYYDGSVVRFYANNNLVITPAAGITIKKVEIVRQSTASNNGGTINCSGLTAADGNTTTNTNVYTGSATSAVTFTAAAQARFTAINVYYTGTPSETYLSSIAVKTAPTKVEYTEGDFFDPAGLVITKIMSDETTEDVEYAGNESDFTFSPALDAALKTTDAKVTITYAGKPVDQAITVAAAPEVGVSFENELTTYADWTFNGITSKSTTLKAKTGAYHGVTSAGTAYAVTKTKVNPASLSFYVSKCSGNTTASTWKIQVSSNGTDWTDIKSQSATSMSQGTWVEVSANASDFAAYTNVFVRIYYSNSTAIRAIDDIVLTTRELAKSTVSFAQPAHGTVSASATENVEEGTQVTLTYTPADGYKLTAFDAYKTGDETTKVTVTDGKFTMPAFDVTATATIEVAKVFDGTELTLSGEYPTEFWKGDAFSHDGMTVTAHFNTGDETVTGVFSGYNMSNAGVQTVTVTFTEGGVSQTATYDITVKTIENTAATAYTPAQAKALYDAGKDLATKVYVKGIVSEMASTSLPAAGGYLNFYISEDGQESTLQFECYKTYKAAGSVKWTSIDEVQVGDEVIAYGKLTYYAAGDVYEFDGNTESYVVSLNRPVVLKSIELNTDDVKKTYKIGSDDVFSAENLVVTAHYNVSSNDKTIDLANVSFSGYNMAVPNTYEVTVSYTENEVTKTATYEIQVKPNCDNLATITMGATEHGTFDLSVKGEQCAETAISTVLTAEPATHYHLASVTATNGTVGAIEGNTCTISDITANSEITVVFEEDAKGTATFVAGAAEATGTAPAAITKYVGETLTIPANTFALAGHTFAGWKYNETIYQKGDEFTVAGDAEFVAQWEALPVMASTYSSNIDLTKATGSNVYSEKVKVNGESTEYPAVKLGTSSKDGNCTIKVPAGATALHFHAVTWSGSSATATLSIKNGTTELFGNVIRPNTGLTGSSPYTLAGDATQDYYCINFVEALAEETSLVFDASVNRFAIYGVNYVAPAAVSLDAASYTFEDTKENATATLDITATKNIFATGDIAVSFEGADAAAFSAGAVDAETGKFTVTFAPTEVRAYSAIVKVSVDGVEATATLAGEGISASTPTISTDVETIDFGSVKQDASVAAQTVNVTLEYLDAANVAITGTVFSIDKTTLTETGAITISANTATMGTYSETLTISGEGAESKTVTITMEVTSKYASEYTSNVTVSGDKVVIDEVEYEAIKKGTSSKSETATITVPKGTQTLHFHAAAWNNEATVLVVKQGETTLGSFNLYQDAGVKSNSPFTLAGDNYDTDQYFNVSVAAYTAEAEAEITFTTTASPYRFVLYGVNQEGGIVPVLDHIAIEGTASKLEYEIGEQFSTEGLSVKAYYTLEGVEQDPVDVTAKADVYSDPTTFIEAGENVNVTVYAEFEGKQATRNVTVKVAEAAPEYNITISAMENGTVTASAETAKEGVSITLTVTPATGYKLGTLTVVDAESNEVTVTSNKFSMPASDVTVSATFVEIPVAPAGAIVFAASNTNSDGSAWTTSSEVSSVFSQGAALVSAITAADKVYPGKNSVGGAKFGSSKGSGTITFTLATPVNVAKIIVSAAAYSDSDKGFTINDKEVAMTDATVDAYDTYEVAFNGAEVSEITLTSTNRVRIEYIYIVKVDVVREGLTPNNYGTICLEKNLTSFSGATFFDITYIDEEGVIILDAIVESELIAGKPYIFLAEAAEITGIYGSEVAAVAGSHNGLYGSFTEGLLNVVDATAYGNGYLYVISNNQYRQAGAKTSVGKHRAYINLDEVPTTPVAPSPSRRRVAMGTQGSQVTTDIENVNVNDNVNKLMIDGKLYIIRNNQMYNVNGQLVK